MGRYAKQMPDDSKVAKAQGSHLRIHFKHARNIVAMVRGKDVAWSKRYLQDVIDMKSTVTFTRYTGGIGATAQAKQQKAPGNKGRWPVKATQVILDMLKNAEANAEAKGMDTANLVITATQCNRAPGGRRRTYRAHGRIGPYMSEPAHIEMQLIEKPEKVQKEADVVGRRTRKEVAKKRFVKIGGGV